MDQKKTKLIGNIAKLAIAIPGVILFVMIALGKGGESAISNAINLSMIGLIACAAIALIFGLKHFFGNIGKSKGMLFGLVGFIVVLAISYALATGEVSAANAADGITEKISKLSGAGVNTVLVLLGVAVATAVLSELSKLVKG